MDSAALPRGALPVAATANGDTARLARQGSVHLNFAPPSGKVLTLAGQGDGPVMDPANAVAFEENAKLAKFQEGPIAQLVEQRAFNPLVAGSIPAGLTAR